MSDHLETASILERVPTQGRFEVLCASLEEYEPLPELAPGAVETGQRAGQHDHEDSIDAEILAWLVLP